MVSIIAFLVPFLLALLPTAAFAGGDLLVTPTRLVFEGRERTAEIGLVNTGKEAATYRISLVNQRMTRMGAFERVTTPTSPTGEAFASHLIRYFPRQVVLQPGESQTVRVEVRKPAGFKDGEYRSHMLFRAIPVGAPVKSGEPGGAEINIVLTPVFGLSIPIIVRQGKLAAAVVLEKPRLELGKHDKPTFFKVTLRRSGSSSVYGNIKVTHIALDETATPLLELQGIAVYTPNSEREMRLDWNRPSGLDVTKGKFRFEFSDAKTHAVLSTMDLKLK